MGEVSSHAAQWKAQFNYSEGDVAFTLTYDVTQQYGGGGYLAYDVAASRDKNPLFGALRAKAEQLRKAPAAAVRLIIACDGDCALLHQSPFTRTPGTYNARDVAVARLGQEFRWPAYLGRYLAPRRRRSPVAAGTGDGLKLEECLPK